ncbi:hypothetical protein D3C79_909130 [compost metagenome]
MFEVFFRDTDAVVLDIQPGHVARLTRDQLHAALGRGEFQCVVHQVPDDLFQTRGVGLDHQCLGRGLQLDLDVVPVIENHGVDVTQYIVQVHSDRLQLELAGADPGDIQ